MVLIEGINQYIVAEHIACFEKAHISMPGASTRWHISVEMISGTNAKIPCPSEEAADMVIEQLKLAVKSAR